MPSDDGDDEESGGGYHGDQEGATPLDTPRSCTDCFCLLIFLIGCGGLCAVGSFTSQSGDPRWLASLPDSDGQLCGLDERGPLLFVCGVAQGGLDLTRRVCVDACPINTTSFSGTVASACPWPGATYASKALGGLVCMPSLPEAQGSLISNAYINRAFLVSEVLRAWPLLLIAAGTALILSLGYLCILELCAFCVISSGLVLLTTCFGCLGGWLLTSPSTDVPNDQADLSHLDVKFVAGVACLCVAFGILCVACCQCRQLRMASESVRETCQCLLEEPSLLVEPCLGLILRVSVLAVLLFGFLWLLSCGRDPGRDPATDNVSRPFWDFTDAEMCMIVYYVIMAGWILELCHALSLFVVAYTVELWYFGSEKDGSPCCGLGRAYCVGIEHHLGTLVCGAFLVASLRIPRIIIGVFARAASDTGNPAGDCLGYFFGCIVTCFTRWLEYVNKNAYMDVAMNSTGFCTAAQHASEVLSREAVAEAALNTASPIIQMAGLGSISAIGAAQTFCLATKWSQFRDHDSERYVREPALVAASAAVCCFFIAWPILHIFDTVADTILYCISTEASRKKEEEEEDEGGVGFPCLVSSCFGGGQHESERLL